MKNVFLTPTNNKTNLYETPEGLLLYYPNLIDKTQLKEGNVGHFLCITSESKYKVGDYVHIPNGMTQFEDIVQVTNEDIDVLPSLNAAKIIMTSDPDLIKKGVQEIATNYLQWYTKHRVDYLEVKRISENSSYYGIILPKLEPSDKITQLNSNQKIIEAMNESLLEEAAKEFTRIKTYHVPIILLEEAAFKAGAKWQEEKNENHEFDLANRIIADIRNKMGHVSILLHMLSEEPDDYVKKRIEELRVKSEETMDYLRNLNAKNFK